MFYYTEKSLVKISIRNVFYTSEYPAGNFDVSPRQLLFDRLPTNKAA